MKKVSLILMAFAVTVLCLFASCKRDKTPDNFPDGCPNFTTNTYAGDILDAMKPGIYEYIQASTFGKTAVIAKSTDGGVFFVDDIDYIAPDHSNFIGSTLYYGFYAVDGQNSSYALYGEILNNGDKAQYYSQREFLDRKAMIKGLTAVAGEEADKLNFALKVATAVHEVPMALARDAYNYDTFFDTWEPIYDTVVAGIPVTCYSHDGRYFYVDKNWMCLCYKYRGQSNSVTGNTVFELKRFTEAGTFEQTYEKIYELYGPSLPKPQWSTCIKGYLKQADEWLTNDYPRSLDDWFKVFNGNGKIHDMEISRRAPWNPLFDRVCTITVKIENVSYADAMTYKQSAATVCDDITKDEFNSSAGTLHFKGSLENVDISGLTFGDSYFHPGYEIELSEEGVLTIIFDVIKTTLV